jgi:hypothetical protein
MIIASNGIDDVCESCKKTTNGTGFNLKFGYLDGMPNYRICDRCLYEKLTGVKLEFTNEFINKKNKTWKFW